MAELPSWLRRRVGPGPLHGTAPILGCRDVDASIAYFVDVLGFTCLPEDRFGFEGEGTVYATMSRADNLVHLQIRRRPVFAGPRESIETDAYLYVADADAVHDAVVARGATVFRELCDEPYGLRDFTVETPDGHRLAFGSTL